MSSPIAAPAPPKKLATPQAHATNPSTSGDVQADSPLPPPPAYLPAPAPAAINGMLPPIAAAIANPPKKLATPQAHATKPSTSGEVRVDSPTPPLLALQRSHSLRGGSCDSYSFGPPKSGRAGTNTAGATASTRPATEKPASAASDSRWALSSDVGVLQQEVQQLRQSLDVAHKNNATLVEERTKRDRISQGD